MFPGRLRYRQQFALCHAGYFAFVERLQDARLQILGKPGDDFAVGRLEVEQAPAGSNGGAVRI